MKTVSVLAHRDPETGFEEAAQVDVGLVVTALADFGEGEVGVRQKALDAFGPGGVCRWACEAVGTAVFVR